LLPVHFTPHLSRRPLKHPIPAARVPPIFADAMTHFPLFALPLLPVGMVPQCPNGITRNKACL